MVRIVLLGCASLYEIDWRVSIVPSRNVTCTVAWAEPVLGPLTHCMLSRCCRYGSLKSTVLNDTVDNDTD